MKEQTKWGGHPHGTHILCLKIETSSDNSNIL